MAVPTPFLNLSDIQGDIILGFPKRVEDFIFFAINGDVSSFRRVIGSEQFLELITPVSNTQDMRRTIQQHKAQFSGTQAPLIPLAAVNIAFTQFGLNLCGLTDDIGDPAFRNGQFSNAQELGDNGTVVGGRFDPDWHPAFKGVIHGVILVAGDSAQSLRDTETKLFELLGNNITQVFKVFGQARPGAEKGHEHFGYMDGISDPAVQGIVSPLPGQHLIPPGVLLMGQPGDNVPRPNWAINGSIMVYRHLDQLVPEFDEFKRENRLFPFELPIEEGAELLGARLMGRWKSGAPVDISPLKDDPVLADPPRNNIFDFSINKDQTSCPFAAHIRKMNPRSDLPPDAVAAHSIKRSGIPFGPEVTDVERSQNRTSNERGLAFVCYQSNLSQGFEFMQKSWANNVGFPINKPILPGFDPIIGQNSFGGRQMSGYDPRAQANTLPLPQFVVSKGGAYFFSPSISTLRTRIGIPVGAPIIPIGGGAPIIPIGGGAPIIPIGGGAPIIPIGGGAPIIPIGGGAPIIPIGGGAPVFPVSGIIPIGGAPVAPISGITPIGGPIMPA